MPTTFLVTKAFMIGNPFLEVPEGVVVRFENNQLTVPGALPQKLPQFLAVIRQGWVTEINPASQSATRKTLWAHLLDD